MKLLDKLKLNKLSASFWGYILVILAIVLPWFFRSGYLFFTDNVWGPIIGFNWTSAWFILKFLLHSLSLVAPPDFVEKIFITGVLSLILFGGRFLTKAILERRTEKDTEVSSPISSGLVFVLSLFALFNPFVYDRALYGQFGVLIAYGFLFFALAYLLKVFRAWNFKKLMLAALFSGLTLMFAVHFIFLLAPLYLIFFGALFVRRKEIRAAGQARSFWLMLLAAMGIVLVLNANWLFAVVSGASPVVEFVEQGISRQDLVAFQTSGRTPVETFTNVVSMSGFWGKDQYRYTDLTAEPGWRRAFIILLPLIFYGIYLSFRRRSRREKVFSASLLGLYTIAVILAVGIKSPFFAPLTLWLYDHLPLYKGLREPQKLVAIIVPIYLFYLSSAVYRLASSGLFSRLLLSRRRVIALILALVIFAQAPLLAFGFAGQVRPTPYPADWYEVNALLASRSLEGDNCSDQILFLPWHLYMSFAWVGKVIANPAPVFFTCPVVRGTNMEWGGIYDNSQNPDSAAINSWLAEQGLSGPPPVYAGKSFRYLILAKELDWQNYAWLSSLPYLRLMKETETLFVYEIK